MYRQRLATPEPFGGALSSSTSSSSSSSASAAGPTAGGGAPPAALYRGEYRLKGLQQIANKKVFDDVVSGNFFELSLFAPRIMLSGARAGSRSGSAAGSGSGAGGADEELTHFVFRGGEFAAKTKTTREPINSMMQWMSAWDNVVAVARSHESKSPPPPLPPASAPHDFPFSLSAQMLEYRHMISDLARTFHTKGDEFVIQYDVEHRSRIFSWESAPLWWEQDPKHFTNFCESWNSAAAAAQKPAQFGRPGNHKNGGGGRY